MVFCGKQNLRSVLSATCQIIADAFYAFLSVGIVFIPVCVPISVDTLNIIQCQIATVIVFHGMNHLALPNDITRIISSYSDSPGVLDVISPDEIFGNW